MATLLEKVAETRDHRAAAEQAFVQALTAARRSHSWQEIADRAGLTPSGVRYLVHQHNLRRQKLQEESRV